MCIPDEKIRKPNIRDETAFLKGCPQIIGII
jgi:hypothetical protein